jgi:hypothetical protein
MKIDDATIANVCLLLLNQNTLHYSFPAFPILFLKGIRKTENKNNLAVKNGGNIH